MLKMIHPDIDAVASVVDNVVYNAVWAPRGWVLLGEPEAWASENLARTVKNLDDLKVDELKALVAYRGAEYPASVRKKDDVKELYLATFAPPAEQAPADTEIFGVVDETASSGAQVTAVPGPEDPASEGTTTPTNKDK